MKLRFALMLQDLFFKPDAPAAAAVGMVKLQPGAVQEHAGQSVFFAQEAVTLSPGELRCLFHFIN